jgi:DNA invertase Pin-like site-specific DNA recombinase
METCHRNDDGFDNRLCNLRWGTRSENRIEGFNNNVNPRGENHYAARLTEHKAKEALKMIKAGQSVPEIAQCLGVTRATIYPLKKGRTWKHLSDNQGALR